MSACKKLPIGIQTFAEIRQEGHYYVDKTPQIVRLIDEGKYYFLSRPKRFGKSLLIDTIAELFEGRRKLFEGCMPKQIGTGRKRRSTALKKLSPVTMPSWKKLRDWRFIKMMATA